MFLAFSARYEYRLDYSVFDCWPRICVSVVVDRVRIGLGLSVYGDGESIMAPQEVKFQQNRLGGVALVIDGCKYRINRRAGTTVYWRCFFRWCRANAVVEDGKLKSSCGKHICDQPVNGIHGSAGRHRQRQIGQQLQQTPSSVIQQQTPVSEVHQRPRLVAAPAASSSSSSGSGGAPLQSGPTVKMATRAAQGSATQTLTRNASKAKVLRTQKTPTNNNMVVRRKSKANADEDNKSMTLPLQPTPTSMDSPLSNGAPESNSSPKQVRQLVGGNQF